MSVEITDGLGGRWDEDGIPFEDSNIQEPIQVYIVRPVKASYASLQSENAELKRLEQACIQLYVGEITMWAWRESVRNSPEGQRLIALANSQENKNA